MAKGSVNKVRALNPPASPRIEPMDTTVGRPPIGQLLDGRYRVESLIARGGMAIVYLGTDTRLDRTVALKIMHAELANDEDFVRRFVGEARSVARLAHPNVVTVYDQGADGRILYLAMEHVPGRTLRDLLNERGRLGPHEALDIMDGVLAGLAAAHDAGLIHRDVKPENVLLADSHTVKVADFGLARLLAGASHTKSGMIIGTAAYLAPEQVSGGMTDARTDVYAAGVMLFELLTGRQPHTGETPLAVAYQHVSEVVPPPSSVVPGLAPALDALVALATSRDPELRPADAGQFLRAITGVRGNLPPASPGAPQEGNGHAAHNGTPPAGLAILPSRWPEQPVAETDPDLIPGMYPPARQSYGMPRADPAPAAATQQFQHDPYRPGSQHTLIVSVGGDTLHDSPPPRRYRGPAEPRLQRLLFSRRLGYLAVALVAVLVIGALAWWLTAGRYTTVPQVGGMTAAAARAELRGAGFGVTMGKTQLDNQVARGRVIRTLPASGAQVVHGGRITLIVSAGPHMIGMPQVTGLALAAAQAAIRHAGLVPGTVSREPSATIPAGIVISTHPAAGFSWPQPRPVTLFVSAGPPVPDFVGQPKQVAEQWAQANGVSLDEITIAKSDAPAGTITHQSPAAGSVFTRGQVIIIKISAGPPAVKIPNVDGMKVDKATHMLQELGFTVNVNQVGPLDTIISYSPSGEAPKGSTITLWVGL